MSDIVARLRAGAYEYMADGNLIDAAADEIEMLRQAIADWQLAAMAYGTHRGCGCQACNQLFKLDVTGGE